MRYDSCQRDQLEITMKGYFIFPNGWFRGVTVIVAGIRHSDPSSNPRQDYISHRANILGKGMNPNVFSPAIGK